MRRAALLFVFAALAVAWTVPAHAATAESDLAASVDPMIGTGSTSVGGPIDTFPGADAPFGMVQWSPDTPSQPAGGGYNYTDGQITGFSLTHLSGPGCSVFGDIGIEPATGSIADPSTFKQPFGHAGEVAEPGYYAVWLGEPAIRARFAVTPRTGVGEFAFPASPAAQVLVNASSDQAGVFDADVEIKGDREVVGSAASGWFCGMPDAYTVYFALRFDRPFASYGTWRAKQVSPGSARVQGAASGGWVTFDATTDPVVRMQASVSWVSVAGAEANLDAEAKTFDVDRVRAATRAQWDSMLGRVAVEGGTERERRTFYTALYHAMLHPNVYSDADGRYRGFDGQVHRAAPGHVEYATFSGWDIYRTQVPLIAMLAPQQTSDMMRSMVHAAQQSGWLPKWSLVNGETSVMGGDAADPIIAGAYAFGAHDFDVRAALEAMVRGATETGGAPGQGWYRERPGLDEYQSRGYVVNQHTTNVSPVPNGASLTLEYALDDFSIARLAGAVGRHDVERQMLARSGYWANLFDTATGAIVPRDAGGAFERTAVGPNGQSGFQEGNGAQYTWMVPQDLAGLVAGMGGPAAATARLDGFFTQIDAGQDKPFAWLGNEPSLGSPWAYLSVGAPWKAQSIIRAAMTQLYDDTPDGIPGNDDLGTMSSWYVWCALGLYPQNPSVPVLDIGTPLFRHVAVRVPGGVDLEIQAPRAADAAAYIRAVRLDGRPWSKSWLPLSAHEKATLTFDVTPSPEPRWANTPADEPPSYPAGKPAFPPTTAARLALAPQGDVVIAPGGRAALHLTLDGSAGSAPASVAWQFSGLPDGVSVDRPSGSFAVAGGASQTIDLALTAAASLRSGIYDVSVSARAEGGAPLAPVMASVRVARAGERPSLAYAVNFLDNTITPIDVRTMSVGSPIAVGANPSTLVVSPDGVRIYTANSGSNDVTVVDASSLTTMATVHVGRSPSGIAIAGDGKTVWVANSSDNTVQPIDAATLTPGAPIAVGLSPQGLAISPDGSRLYVADQNENAVTPVDVRSGKTLPEVAVGRKPVTVAFAPDGKTVYVADQVSAAVTPIDVASGAAGTPIPAGIAPQGIAVSPDGALLLVADSGADTITPIDLRAGRPLAPIVVGLNPVALAFAPAGDVVFVTNLGDGDCVPVDLRTRQVGQRIEAGNWPFAIAR